MGLVHSSPSLIAFLNYVFSFFRHSSHLRWRQLSYYYELCNRRLHEKSRLDLYRIAVDAGPKESGMLDQEAEWQHERPSPVSKKANCYVIVMHCCASKVLLCNASYANACAQCSRTVNSATSNTRSIQLLRVHLEFFAHTHAHVTLHKHMRHERKWRYVQTTAKNIQMFKLLHVEHLNANFITNITFFCALYYFYLLLADFITGGGNFLSKTRYYAIICVFISFTNVVNRS